MHLGWDIKDSFWSSSELEGPEYISVFDFFTNMRTFQDVFLSLIRFMKSLALVIRRNLRLLMASIEPAMYALGPFYSLQVGTKWNKSRLLSPVQSMLLQTWSLQSFLSWRCFRCLVPCIAMQTDFMQEVKCDSNPIDRYTHFHWFGKESFLQRSYDSIIHKFLKLFG
jgi:hypothetical protein